MQNINYSGQYYNNHNYNIKIRTGEDILNATGDAICGEFMIATGGANPGLYIATQTSGDDFEIYRVSEISAVNKLSFFSGKFSASFNGVDSYIDAGNIAGLDSATDFSISLWVYNDSAHSFNGNKALIASGGTGTDIYFFRGGNQEIRLQVGGGTIVTTTSIYPIMLDAWNHVAATYSNGTAKIYINGILRKTGPTGNSGVGTGNNFSIGAYSSLNNYYFQGLIDEVAVFDRVLSDGSVNDHNTAGGDIAQIYNNGKPQNLQFFNPLHWWRMEDGVGFTATDYAGSNDGTLVNAIFSNNTPS